MSLRSKTFQGPEVRSGDIQAPIDMKTGDIFHFTIKVGANGHDGRISVNYDGFIDDVSVGDTLLVDGGLISFLVKGKSDTDVDVEVRRMLFGNVMIAILNSRHTA